MLKLVIFDLDGVIVDTAKYHYLAWRELGFELGFEFTEKQNEAFKGVSRLACMDIMCTLAGKEDMPTSERERIANQKNDKYLELIKNIKNDELLDGVERLLKDLKSAGIKVALGSASKNALPILEKTNILHYFDAVIDGNKVKKAKPDPEVFELAAKELGILNNECIVFEDAVAGIEAALKAGMAVIGIGTQENLPNAKHLFNNVGETTIEFLKMIV
ncbi:beta-phosphoglucomutase [Candidatus Epulonipiscioides gigas]|nr:beta-phosphoglucomutase [Epulopiscium sp. SCG-C07WGA-EpuloA2]